MSIFIRGDRARLAKWSLLDMFVLQRIVVPFDAKKSFYSMKSYHLHAGILLRKIRKGHRPQIPSRDQKTFSFGDNQQTQ